MIFLKEVVPSATWNSSGNRYSTPRGVNVATAMVNGGRAPNRRFRWW
jgi:hypothetical protein